MKIRRSQDADTIQALDAEIFPADSRVAKSDDGWLAHDADGRAVAFATGKLWAPDNYYLFTRCGVLAEARGRGLQRRLIRVRVAHAKKIGAKGAYTYTLASNAHSANNLIACGFKMWRPSYKWAGASAVYWAKEF